MAQENIDELKRQIKELESKVAYLNAQLKEDNRFGLKWIDVPEAFDAESENKIPILEEVPELAITNNDGKPTHILIEGDNYHALTCLNYTHHGKVDVIYIDPPYNTGSDGFTYKDKRFLDKFPDGVKLPANHPLRHSAWLSFMQKRLKLAKELLSDRGVIFISIDDNEHANLKLLCDNIFGENNYVAKFDWRKKTGANDAKDIAVITETILLYSKNHTKTISEKIWSRDESSVNKSRYKYEDEFVKERGRFYYDTLDRGGLQYSDSMNYGIEAPDGGLIFPNGRTSFENDGWIWKWGYDKVQWGIRNKFLEFKKSSKSKGSAYTIKYKVYEKVDNEGNIRVSTGRAYSNLILEPINQQGNSEIKDIFNETTPFSNPKPIVLISYLLRTIYCKQSVILDFFAGSGTTMHSTMQLNAEDGGHRQCILINLNENNICRDVTYERNKRVIEGYVTPKGLDVEGLGNSLKYYRTAFVGANDCGQATDNDKTVLAQKAGCLLALAENTLYEQKTTGNYQIFKDKDKDVWTAVYFKEDYRPKFFNEFVDAVKALKGIKNVYIFSWGDVGPFEAYFDDDSNVQIKGIPQPILDIYKSLNQ